MQPELKNGKHFFTGFLLDFLKGIKVPWIQHYGLLANSVCVIAQSQADMGVVHVVRRTDAYIIDFVILLSFP